MKTLALVLLAGCGALPVGEQDEGLAKRSSPTVCAGGPLTTLDQSQLNSISVARLGEATQTIIAGKSGQLTGVAMSVSYCGWNDRKAQLELAVLDAEGVPLATAQIAASGLQQSCSAMPIGSTSPLFDFSAACVHVAAGQPLTLQLSTVGVRPGACNFTTSRCASGRVNQFCVENADCASADLRAGMGFDTYLDGFASIDGVGYAVYDLSFKTLVR